MLCKYFGVVDMCRILVAEADVSLNALITAALDDKHKVISTSTNSEVLNAVNGHSFDLAFMDFKLADGAAIHAIQACIRKNIPVIVITAHERYQSICRQLGVEHYIVKPVSTRIIKALAAASSIDDVAVTEK